MSDGRRRLRARVREAVEALATAIDAGRVRPELDELEALATLCDRQSLEAEAVRVRSWYRKAWTSGQNRRPS